MHSGWEWVDALNAREAVSPSGKVNKHDNGGLIMAPPPRRVFVYHNYLGRKWNGVLLCWNGDHGIMVIVWYFLNFTLTYQFFFLESYPDGDLKLLICVFSLKVGMGRWLAVCFSGTWGHICLHPFLLRIRTKWVNKSVVKQWTLSFLVDKYWKVE